MTSIIEASGNGSPPNGSGNTSGGHGSEPQRPPKRRQPRSVRLSIVFVLIAGMLVASLVTARYWRQRENKLQDQVNCLSQASAAQLIFGMGDSDCTGIFNGFDVVPEEELSVEQLVPGKYYFLAKDGRISRVKFISWNGNSLQLDFTPEGVTRTGGPGTGAHANAVGVDNIGDKNGFFDRVV